MDKHQILKAYSNYTKMLMQARREDAKKQALDRKYTKLYSKTFGEQSEEKFSLEGCSKRKYITLIPKAD